MLSINTCQISQCMNSQFVSKIIRFSRPTFLFPISRQTYCPHCSLNVCLNCLHHHYGLMKNEYRQNLIDCAMQLHVNRQQTIEQEKDICRRLFQIRSIQYDSMEHYFVEKQAYHAKTDMRAFQLSDCYEIKQKHVLMMDMHQRFDQLLNEISRLISDFQTNRHSSCESGSISSSNISNDNSSAFAIETSSVTKTEAVLPIELDDDELPPTQTTFVYN